MAKITKIVKLQSAKFKTHQNGSNETSIFLSHSDCEVLGLTKAEKVKFTIYKEDFILGLGMLMTLSTLPLYSKEVANLSTEDYKKYLEIIESFFGDKEKADYEVNFFINTSQADRNYFNELKYNGLNIRHFLVENHSCLYFERLENEFVLRFKTYADELEGEEDEVNDDDVKEEINKSATKYTSPIQKIFYAVPGCGKSHKISEMMEDKSIFEITSEENQIVRTVFHPDYTNADFVGQILPEVNGSKIEYNFKAGPFTEILAKALVHSENQYVLIIEEINRGNSAAIFGEIFQLLDRLEGEKTSSVGGNKYGKGWSEYFFMNDLINEYVRKMASPSDNVETSVQINGIIFTENTGIRLPPNLSLLATMNTSDQNVFTLDNAFQRRWDMEYISNKYEESKANEKQKAQYNSKIGETTISWGKFRDAINKEISNPENSFANAEDKQLGLFFIKAENNVIKESDFSNKVLKYLWNDIFKRDKSIFNDDVSTFGDLLEVFSGADAFTNSFSSDFVSKIAE